MIEETPFWSKRQEFGIGAALIGGVMTFTTAMGVLDPFSMNTPIQTENQKLLGSAVRSAIKGDSAQAKASAGQIIVGGSGSVTWKLIIDGIVGLEGLTRELASPKAPAKAPPQLNGQRGPTGI